MALTQPKNWVGTKRILEDLENDLKCPKCGEVAANPRTFANCLHFFCHTCIDYSKNACSVCKVPSSAKEIYHDNFLENVSAYVSNIVELLKPPGTLSVNDHADFAWMKPDGNVKSVCKAVLNHEDPYTTVEGRSGFSPRSDLMPVTDRKSNKKQKGTLTKRFSLSVSKSVSYGNKNRSSDSASKQNPSLSSNNQEESSELYSSEDIFRVQSYSFVNTGTPNERNTNGSHFEEGSVYIAKKKAEKEGEHRQKSSPVFFTPKKIGKKGRQSGDLQSKNVILTAKKSVNKRNTKGETPLHVACRKGNLIQVQNLIADGANPNVKDNFGWTPLHEALNYSHIDIVKELIEKGGAWVNTPGGGNYTPLHKAVAIHVLEGIKLLVEWGSNPQLVDIYGNIPVDYAQSDEVVRIFENPGAYPSKCSTMSSLSEDSEYEYERIVFFGEWLSKSDQKKLGVLSTLIPASRVAHTLTSDVTHIVVKAENGTCAATVNVLHGILSGKHFVSMEWVEHSIEIKSIKHQHSPLVKSTKGYPHAQGLIKARKCIRNLLPSLFSGMHFALSSVCRNMIYNNIKKDDLSSLVVSGGGQFLSREPDPEAIPPKERTVPYYANNFVADFTGLKREHPLKSCSHVILYHLDETEATSNNFLRYNMVHIKSLPVAWFVGCIESFTLLDPSPFL